MVNVNFIFWFACCCNSLQNQKRSQFEAYWATALSNNDAVIPANAHRPNHSNEVIRRHHRGHAFLQICNIWKYSDISHYSADSYTKTRTMTLSTFSAQYFNVSNSFKRFGSPVAPVRSMRWRSVSLTLLKPQAFFTKSREVISASQEVSCLIIALIFNL